MWSLERAPNVQQLVPGKRRAWNRFQSRDARIVSQLGGKAADGLVSRNFREAWVLQSEPIYCRPICLLSLMYACRATMCSYMVRAILCRFAGALAKAAK